MEPATIAKSFKQLELVIERGLHTFVEVGQALLEIRDRKLYRAEYPTFEEYCKQRWGWSKSHVNRQIDAAGVIQNLTPIGVIPQHESQARPLTSLPPDDQRAAWEAAVAANGPQPTAKQILTEVMRRV